MYEAKERWTYCFSLEASSVTQAKNPDRLVYAPSGLKWNAAARYVVDLNGDGQLEDFIHE